MSRAGSIQPFDFRKRRHSAPSVPRPVAQWHERIGTLAGEAWGKYLANNPAWTPGRSAVCSFAEAVSELPDPGLGIALTLGDPAVNTFWVFEQAHILSLVADLLGMNRDTDAGPRPLTAIEESMAQLLISEMVWAVGEAWPGRTSIPCRIGDLDRRPVLSRLFAPGDVAFVSRFNLSGAAGDFECTWLIPLQALERAVSAEWPEDRQAAPVRDATAQLEQLAGTLSLTLSVRLGEARLPVSQLADLQIGDVIVLDQPITRPVVAEVGGEPKFLGFPGRIGSRQSFQVHAVMDT
jgi:flagellar motor switch protein FliM